MSSEVDVCNLALSHLGDSAGISSISPPDGSVQADYCKTFYPMARDAVLESHNWRFAMKRQSLAVLSVSSLPAEWGYCYAYPTCLKLVSVFPPDAVATAASGAIFDQSEFLDRPGSQPFVVESLEDGTQVVYTNVEDATAHYIANVSDTTKFSPLCILAIARLLASYLAGPVIKGKEGMAVAAKQLEWYEKIDSVRAKASDSQAGKETSYNDFVPGGLAARR